MSATAPSTVCDNLSTRERAGSAQIRQSLIRQSKPKVDIYFSADVETDGPVPGPYSMLSFALVVAGRFDGQSFEPETQFSKTFYAELEPISENFEEEALAVNGLNRNRLKREGQNPKDAMNAAYRFVEEQAGADSPVLVAYPLSFDWSWLYWYFVRFADSGSPFKHSRCYDLKTAYAVKADLPIAASGRHQLPEALRSKSPHSHNALDDAIEQAEIFTKLFEWHGDSKG